MEDRAQKTSDSNISLARTELKNGLRRGGNRIHFKVFVHDQENIEVFRSRFRGDETTPK